MTADFWSSSATAGPQAMTDTPVVSYLFRYIVTRIELISTVEKKPSPHPNGTVARSSICFVVVSLLHSETVPLVACKSILLFQSHWFYNISEWPSAGVLTQPLRSDKVFTRMLTILKIVIKVTCYWVCTRGVGRALGKEPHDQAVPIHAHGKVFLFGAPLEASPAQRQVPTCRLSWLSSYLMIND